MYRLKNDEILARREIHQVLRFCGGVSYGFLDKDVLPLVERTH